jgi:3-oxoacyl-[acyl-carrier-protein] synthase III
LGSLRTFFLWDGIGIVLSNPGAYLPSTVLTNAELADILKDHPDEAMRFSPDEIRKKTGMLERLVAVGAGLSYGAVLARTEHTLVG